MSRVVSHAKLLDQRTAPSQYIGEDAPTSMSNTTFVQLLIDAGIDLSMKSPEETTPFHYACEEGNLEVVELLLRNLPDYDMSSDIHHGLTFMRKL